MNGIVMNITVRRITLVSGRLQYHGMKMESYLLNIIQR
jgi:hypothetical protein